MQLTEDERAALERYRGRHDFKSYPEYVDDLIVLGNLAIRERPVRTYGDLVIRWDDEITPERLQACGFVLNKRDELCVNGLGLVAQPQDNWTTWVWFVMGQFLPTPPRNMLDVWSVMERCGIEEGGK